MEKYTELESQGELDESGLFEETGKALLAEGVVLRRRGGPMVRRYNNRKDTGGFTFPVTSMIYSISIPEWRKWEGERENVKK